MGSKTELGFAGLTRQMLLLALEELVWRGRMHCRVGGTSQNAVDAHFWLLGSLTQGFSSIFCAARRDTAGEQGVLSKKTISLGEIISFTARMSRDSKLDLVSNSEVSYL